MKLARYFALALAYISVAQADESNPAALARRIAQNVMNDERSSIRSQTIRDFFNNNEGTDVAGGVAVDGGREDTYHSRSFSVGDFSLEIKVIDNTVRGDHPKDIGESDYLWIYGFGTVDGQRMCLFTISDRGIDGSFDGYTVDRTMAKKSGLQIPPKSEDGMTLDEQAAIETFYRRLLVQLDSARK